MTAAIEEKVSQWLNSKIDDESRQAIQALQAPDKEEELTEAFYKDLEFGTGGLRGIMGIGSNRINKYTIGMATQGMANYLLKTFPDEEIKVAVAHDSRNNSRYFADITASVFSANGIKVFFFDDLRPVPELSFAIRHLNCHSGVVVTASHNPKEYNGYKAYWGDGGQVVPPHDKNIIQEVENIDGIDAVKFEKNTSLIENIGEEVDNAYLNQLMQLALSPDAVKQASDLKIVFTPIHGTGITLVPRALEMLGFTDVTIVEEQAAPDGDFPTVVYPNPEEAEALSLGLNKARSIDADILMGTDPDADRVGVAVKNTEGEFQLLNGNQTGAMLVHYLLERWKENGKLDGKQFVVKTIVTTDLIERIANHFGVKYYNTLTGFKYIAQLIREKEGQEQFIGGGEESYGYLIGDAVRDKDAVVSCMIIAEMAAYIKTKGLTLFEYLLKIYENHGYFKEGLVSLTKKGKSGSEEIAKIMADLRANPPAAINGETITRMADYQAGTLTHLADGKVEQMGFPKSNVLQFFTEKDTKISARPSGTEPKIKFYISVNGQLASAKQFHAVSQQLDERIENIKKELGV